jgi:hypothetical protein
LELTRKKMIEMLADKVTNDQGGIDPSPTANKWIMRALVKAVECIENGTLTASKEQTHDARYWMGLAATRGTVVGNRQYADMVAWLTSEPVSEALWREVTVKYGGGK